MHFRRGPFCNKCAITCNKMTLYIDDYMSEQALES